MDYKSFLEQRKHASDMQGFKPTFLPDCLMDFQRSLVDWSVRKGRAALFADCGLGKTLMQLCWAQNVVEHTNKPVLILTPLAVGAQTVRESEKFGIAAYRVHRGEIEGDICITNYERLHHYNPDDFAGCVCDESSILKNYKGKYKDQITQFMRKMRYRLLCTATAAPNDYVELGTSSEALGEMGFMDMLGRFFKNDQNPTVDTKRKFAAQGGEVPKWRFKWHAEVHFWEWVASWARAVRRPSDLGYSDDGFELLPLIENDHVLPVSRAIGDKLFSMPAIGLKEQREERRETITERCEKAASLASGHSASILWCHLNAEGDLLEKLMPNSVQVCGSQSEEKKEDMLMAFLNGEASYLVTKPMCAGFGLNMQHCSHMTFFPSHSYEQYYQSVRRCWRFGQKDQVTVDVVTTEGEANVMSNLQKKAKAANDMFTKLVACMHDAQSIRKKNIYTNQQEVPTWL